jgi:fructuronate reductase
VTNPADFPRLSDLTLGSLRAGVARPAYDRSRMKLGIVHLGLGAFVRAHVATYVEDVLAQEFAHWGIAGVSLKRPDQRDKLAPQNTLYTALKRQGDGVTARVVGCVKKSLVAPEDPEYLLAMMTDRAARIVSLTITEKGYCHDPATGRLDERHPDIVHDLENHGAPRTAVGLIVEALERRRVAGFAPFTVLCCDNLPHNGRLVRDLVVDFAAMRETGLATWIEVHGAFPCTMVDRIVPATTDADIAAAAAATGLYDAAPVVHEPFRQWVVEDTFIDGARPAFERVGVELVSDVAPFEEMKLRMLNGAHSSLAYLGYLAGHETIAETVGDDVFARFVAQLWTDEIIPVVKAPPGINLQAYAGQLLARFANRAIRHRTWQIAMDGSQKLPQRLLFTIRDRLATGRPIRRLALAVAAWTRYVSGIDEQGKPIDVRDPLAQHLRTVIDRAGQDPAARARAVIGVEAVFGSDLPRAGAFTGAVENAARLIAEKGARGAAATVTSA